MLRLPQRPYRLFSSISLPARMSPRKKSKPNPQAPADGTNTGAPVPPDATHDTTPSASTALSDADAPQSTPSETNTAESSTTLSNGASTPSTAGTQTPRGKKWLGGTGSWRSKAPAVVKTKAESIGVTGGATGELPDAEAKKPRDDSPTKFLTKRKSSKGSALPTSITKINVSSDGLTEDSPKSTETVEKDPESTTPTIAEPPLPPLPPTISSSEQQAANTWGWRSWWSRPDGYAEAGKAKAEAQGSIEDAQTTPLPGPTPSEEADAKTKGLASGSTMAADSQAPVEPAGEQQETKVADKDAQGTTDQSKARNTSSSWFWRWSNAQNTQANIPADPAKDEPHKPDSNPVAEEPDDQPPPALHDSQTTQETATLTTADGSTESTSTTATSTPPKASAWAFWYRGQPEAQSSKIDGEPQKHVGEVAVFNTPSQSNPEAAQFNEQEHNQAEDGSPKKPQETVSETQEPSKAESLARRSFRSLRGIPKSTNKIKETSTVTPEVSNTATPTKGSPVLEPTRPDTAPAAQAALKASIKAKQEPPNLLLPEFKSTYQLVQQPNFWQQIRRYFLGGEDPMPHLHINPAPPRIRKAVAIGVHGFFPAPIIQKVLGQPTGTSIRFANAAAAAIKDWTEARGYTPEIEQIALEGEGFIAERVNTLWKLLLNWIEHIKQADFILVACHSQGVPVAMMLVAKLIQFGCVNATRIGVCAMAGVNMGPFIEYKTKYFGPTAAELFEFSNPKSLVSQMYLAALDEVLRFGVRIFYVGSIDDQLVSLEVSNTRTFACLAH